MYAARDTEIAPYELMWASADPVGDVVSVSAGQNYRNVYDFSADGSRLMYTGEPGGDKADLFVIDFGDGAPTSTQVNGKTPVSDDFNFPTRFSSDGQRVFFRVDTGGEDAPLATVEVGSGVEPVVLSEPGELVRTIAVYPPAP